MLLPPVRLGAEVGEAVVKVVRNCGPAGRHDLVDAPRELVIDDDIERGKLTGELVDVRGPKTMLVIPGRCSVQARLSAVR